MERNLDILYFDYMNILKDTNFKCYSIEKSNKYTDSEDSLEIKVLLYYKDIFKNPYKYLIDKNKVLNETYSKKPHFLFLGDVIENGECAFCYLSNIEEERKGNATVVTLIFNSVYNFTFIYNFIENGSVNGAYDKYISINGFCDMQVSFYDNAMTLNDYIYKDKQYKSVLYGASGYSGCIDTIHNINYKFINTTGDIIPNLLPIGGSNLYKEFDTNYIGEIKPHTIYTSLNAKNIHRFKIKK